MPRPLITVSIAADNTEEALQAMEHVTPMADAVEIRLDLMRKYDLRKLVRHRPCPVIITNRPAREGGQFQGDETSRLWPLLEAIQMGAEHIDIEWDVVHHLSDVNRGRTRFIVSRHDFQRIPGDLTAQHRELASLGADIVKLAGMACRPTDLIPIFRVLRDAGRPTIAIAMGAVGIASRILALRYPACYLTYAALGNGSREVAPGQIAIADLHRVYHVREIDATTAGFCHLAPALPPVEMLAAGNAALRRAGLNAVWVPMVTSKVERGTLDVLDAMELAGCSVDATLAETMALITPHLTAAARRASQVDVLIRDPDGTWTGHYLGSDVQAWVTWWARAIK